MRMMQGFTQSLQAGMGYGPEPMGNGPPMNTTFCWNSFDRF